MPWVALGQHRILTFRYSARHPTPVLLPGKSHGWRSLEGCSPWDRWGSDTTERLHFHFSLSCIGEGNDNPPQCSCLENPRDGGAWWAAVYGITQSRTRLKQLAAALHYVAEVLISVLQTHQAHPTLRPLHFCYLCLVSLAQTFIQLTPTYLSGLRSNVASSEMPSLTPKL